MNNKTKVLKIEMGKRITKIREDLKMTKVEFAKLLQITDQYLGLIEKGVYCLSVEKIKLLTEKTGISADYIISGTTTSYRDKIINLLSKYNDDEIVSIFDTLQNIEVIIKK